MDLDTKLAFESLEGPAEDKVAKLVVKIGACVAGVLGVMASIIILSLWILSRKNNPASNSSDKTNVDSKKSVDQNSKLGVNNQELSETENNASFTVEL